jgi:hypothetical protein
LVSGVEGIGSSHRRSGDLLNLACLCGLYLGLGGFAAPRSGEVDVVTPTRGRGGVVALLVPVVDPSGSGCWSTWCDHDRNSPGSLPPWRLRTRLASLWQCLAVMAREKSMRRCACQSGCQQMRCLWVPLLPGGIVLSLVVPSYARGNSRSLRRTRRQLWRRRSFLGSTALVLVVCTGVEVGVGCLAVATLGCHRKL